MKEHEEQIIATKIIYECEVCGKKSNCAWDIQSCERKHKQEKCEHEFVYGLVPRREYDTAVTRECKKCRKEEEKDQGNLTEEQLALIWEMIDE